MTRYKMILTLFDGGADSGGGAAPAAENTGDAGRKGGVAPKVVYGKQDPPAQEGSAQPQQTEISTSSNTQDERRKAYKDLVSGEYKDLHTAEIQRIINTRFKETKGLQEALDKQAPLMQMLYARYHVSDGDIQGVMSAMENDDAYWEEAAEEQGLTVEQYKRFQKIERENAQLRKDQQQRMTDERARAQMNDWLQQADALKLSFPDFDLEKESNDPRFIRMLQAGVPMEHAYKTLHFDDLLAANSQEVKTSAEKAVVANIRAKGARPAENGTSSQSAAVLVKDDVSKLNKHDRAEIVRQALAGKQISF